MTTFWHSKWMNRNAALIKLAHAVDLHHRNLCNSECLNALALKYVSKYSASIGTSKPGAFPSNKTMADRLLTDAHKYHWEHQYETF